MDTRTQGRTVRGQSAVELLSTYSWAIIIIIGAIAILYFFVNELFLSVPSQCSFVVMVPCTDVVVTSNTANAVYQIFITNSQDYAIKSPQLYLNVTGLGHVIGNCGPSFVLSGGAIICNATTAPLTIGTTVSGFMLFNQSVCTSIGTSSCAAAQHESFNGTFTTRVGPHTTIAICSIGLSAATATPVHGTLDLLTATVTLSGATIPGATVNFTSSSGSTIIAPSYALSNVNGTALTYVMNPSAGSIVITAKFLKGCSATQSLTVS